MTTLGVKSKPDLSSPDAAMVDVIIVNWNAGALLKSCVDSVLEHGGVTVRHVIVVDNGSIDLSDRAVEELPKVTLIRAGENLGFGRACNLGARYAQSEYLLFLNPDAALFIGTLNKTVSYMEDPDNASIGICGVQLLDEHGAASRSCARFPSPKSLIAHASGLDRLFPRLGSAMVEWDHSQTRYVDQVMGAFFLVRHKLFRTLGGFDERFFVYFEEVDFSLRASKFGWHSVYLANAQAFHAGGGTSAQVKARRLFYVLRSRLLYVFKHFSLVAAFLVTVATLLLEPLSRSELAICRLSWPQLKETWVAYGMLWYWLSNRILKGRTR